MRKNIKLSAIILSAGFSSRMGEFKPLLKFGDQTALELLVKTFKESGVEDVIVVLGHRAEEIMNKFAHLKVKWAINEDYEKGMYSSVKEGVKRLAEESEGFYLIPVDVPLIKASTLEYLKAEFLKGEKKIIYPVFNGKREHPPLISTIYKKHILEDASGNGLKSLLSLYDDVALEVAVSDWGTAKDMDNPSDYEELKQYFKSRHVPNEEECTSIWNKYNLPINIIEHCKAVADAAYSIGKSLCKKGYSIDLDKIKAAALLHDIARKEKDHDMVGAKILRELGYEEIADIISVHMDIDPGQYGEKITEAEIVYLADKLVLGKEVVSLEERFNRAREKFGSNPEIMESINERLNNCRIIIEKINKITGESFLYE